MLVWDATCPDTLAPSYTKFATRKAEAVADEAERKKRAKYSHLEVSHHFVPIAVVTVLFSRSRPVPAGLDSRASVADAVAVQHGNSAAILCS